MTQDDDDIDRWHAVITPDVPGPWTFRVDGWGDPLATWRKNVTAKLNAGQGESELSNDLLCSAGADGYVRRVNPAWSRVLGWTPEEVRKEKKLSK